MHSDETGHGVGEEGRAGRREGVREGGKEGGKGVSEVEYYKY